MYIGEAEGRASRTKVMLISCSISEMCTKRILLKIRSPDPPLMQIQHIMDLSPSPSEFVPTVLPFSQPPTFGDNLPQTDNLMLYWICQNLSSKGVDFMKSQIIHFSQILTSEKLDNIFYQYLNPTQNVFHMKCVWNTTASWLLRFRLFARS